MIASSQQRLNIFFLLSNSEFTMDSKYIMAEILHLYIPLHLFLYPSIHLSPYLSFHRFIYCIHLYLCIYLFLYLFLSSYISLFFNLLYAFACSVSRLASGARWSTQASRGAASFFIVVPVTLYVFPYFIVYLATCSSVALCAFWYITSKPHENLS